MVFILRNINTGEAVVMGVNSKYTLGRSRVNNILLKDYSCSRKHAVIQIKNGFATILDVGSKRGTYLNKQKIFDETKLRNGDIIRFGLNNCRYSFNDPKFQTMVDESVSGNKKIALLETLKALNVTRTEIYSNKCSHYTTEFISMDILKRTRLLDALVDQKPVVTAKFWIDMIRNLQEAVEIPNISRYVPEIENALKIQEVENIVPRKKRKELFKDKLCIFFSKALEKSMEHLIWICGGGTIQHSNRANFAVTLVEGFEFDEAVIVRELPNWEQSLTVTYFIDKLKQCDKNVRELCEDEIYIGVLKGYFENTTETAGKEDGPLNGVRPVSSGDSITIVDSDDHDSCSEADNLSKASNRKKKSDKMNWTTLNRWIRSAKKPKSGNPAGSAGLATGELDISLEMSSSSSSEGQAKDLRKNKDNGPLGINSDDSEPEEQQQTKKQKGPKQQHSNKRLAKKAGSKNQAESARPAKEEFNTSLEMSSSSGSERQGKGTTSDDSEPEKRPQTKKQKEHTKNRNGQLSKDAVVVVSSEEIISKKNSIKSSAGSSFHRTKPSRSKKNLNLDNCDPKQGRKRTAVPERHRMKKNEENSAELEVIEDHNTEELSHELQERLNPSTRAGKTRSKDIESSSTYTTARSEVRSKRLRPLEHHEDRPESSSNVTVRNNSKKQKQPLETIREEASNNSSLDSSESFEMRGKTRRRRNNNDYFVEDDLEELAVAVFSKSKDLSNKEQGSRPERQKKGLRVNPLARLKKTSTPRKKENRDGAVDFERFKKMFKDVDFVPI